jgi:hypothetical protein
MGEKAQNLKELLENESNIAQSERISLLYDVLDCEKEVRNQ